MPDQFVEGVMPPNILSQEEQLTARVEERAGVQATGSLKCLPRLPAFSGAEESPGDSMVGAFR